MRRDRETAAIRQYLCIPCCGNRAQCREAAVGSYDCSTDDMQHTFIKRISSTTNRRRQQTWILPQRRNSSTLSSTNGYLCYTPCFEMPGLLLCSLLPATVWSLVFKASASTTGFTPNLSTVIPFFWSLVWVFRLGQNLCDGTHRKHEGK